jgi:hypothetical protein
MQERVRPCGDQLKLHPRNKPIWPIHFRRVVRENRRSPLSLAFGNLCERNRKSGAAQRLYQVRVLRIESANGVSE